MFDVTPRSVDNWARAGRLPHFLTGGGHYRFDRDDVASLFYAQRPGLPAPESLLLPGEQPLPSRPEPPSPEPAPPPVLLRLDPHAVYAPSGPIPPSHMALALEVVARYGGPRARRQLEVRLAALDQSAP